MFFPFHHSWSPLGSLVYDFRPLGSSFSPSTVPRTLLVGRYSDGETVHVLRPPPLR